MKLKELKLVESKMRIYIGAGEYFEGSFEAFEKTEYYKTAKNVSDMVKSISLDFDGCIRVVCYEI